MVEQSTIFGESKEEFLFRGMILTVSSGEDDSSGSEEDAERATWFRIKLVDFSDEFLVGANINAMPPLPVLPVGMIVELCGTSISSEYVCTVVRVKESTGDVLVTDIVGWVTQDERRKAPRFNTYVPGIVYEEEKDGRTTRDCWVANVSRGGACFISSYEYEPHRLIRLKVQLVEGLPYMKFHGEILRKTVRRDGSFEYGVKFDTLTPSQGAELTSAVYTLMTKRSCNAG